MTNLKINASVILVLILQACALVWFLSNQNSKIESMWADMQELTDKMAIEEDVKMKLIFVELILKEHHTVLLMVILIKMILKSL